MPLLIDGHNLIGQMHDLSLSDPHDEDKLIVRLKQYTERAQKHVTVVFDPSPYDTALALGHGKSKIGYLTIIYAHPGSQADDVIRARVSDTQDKQGLTVVTSDAAVANFTRMNGIRTESSPDFIKRMNAQLSNPSSAHQKPVGSHREVDNWSDIFKEPAPLPGAKPVLPLMEKAARKARKRKKANQLADQIKRVKPLF